MTLDEMKKAKEERGLTNQQIAAWSNLPLPTVQKIFSGETEKPRYHTLEALQKVFDPEHHASAYNLPPTGTTSSVLCETAYQYVARTPAFRYPRQGSYTLDDYYALPDDQRVELIDGVFYDMSAPTVVHQRVAGEIHRQIANYIYDKEGDCIPAMSPVDVRLDKDDKTMVQPDVLILCDESKLETPRYIMGAPDFIAEVLSPSTRSKDCVIKRRKYQAAGVKEYWLIDLESNWIQVFDFRKSSTPISYEITGAIPVALYDSDLTIDMKRIEKWAEEYRIYLEKERNKK